MSWAERHQTIKIYELYVCDHHCTHNMLIFLRTKNKKIKKKKRINSGRRVRRHIRKEMVIIGEITPNLHRLIY